MNNISAGLPYRRRTLQDVFNQNCSSTCLQSPNKFVSPSKFVKLKALKPAKNHDKIEILSNLRHIANCYQQNNITNQLCSKIYNTLEALAKQDSVYGQQMNSFFAILKQLIFCHQPQILAHTLEFQHPFAYLIRNDVQLKYQQLKQKQMEVQTEIEKINRRIEQIQQKNSHLLQIKEIQYENQATAIRVEYQSKISHLRTEIDNLKQLISQKQHLCKKWEGKYLDLVLARSLT